MTIAVVGHLCLDVVESPQPATGSTTGAAGDQFGGILYAVAALSNLLKPSDIVLPVFGVGESDHARLMDELARYPNVSTKAVYKFSEPTNRVRLFYEPGGATRIECSHHISQPIPFSRIKPHLNCDGILLNMISGNDITLSTLDAIRMETRERGTPVHLDLHSLTLGVDGDGKRFRRPLIDWRRWCFMLSSVQMSEEEAAGLSSERYSEDQLINQVMPLMVGTLLITRGARGVSVIRQEHKKMRRHDILGIPVSAAADPTGCGDVFGAAFFWKYLETQDSLAAATFANAAAGVNATATGPSGLMDLRERAERLVGAASA